MNTFFLDTIGLFVLIYRRKSFGFPIPSLVAQIQVAGLGGRRDVVRGVDRVWTSSELLSFQEGEMSLHRVIFNSKSIRNGLQIDWFGLRLSPFRQSLANRCVDLVVERPRLLGNEDSPDLSMMRQSLRVYQLESLKPAQASAMFLRFRQPTV